MAAHESVTGPNLSTLANVKLALGLSGTQDDDRINALMAVVTDEAEGYCDRTFAAGTGIVEYPDIRNDMCLRFRVARPPLTTLTSLWASTGVPRVYDSTTLLVSGTDYDFDSVSGWVERLNTIYFPRGFKTVKITYSGGYTTIPEDLEQACIEAIATKLRKSLDRLWHLTGATHADGRVDGIRFEDWSPDGLRTLDRYRLRTI